MHMTAGFCVVRPPSRPAPTSYHSPSGVSLLIQPQMRSCVCAVSSPHSSLASWNSTAPLTTLTHTGPSAAPVMTVASKPAAFIMPPTRPPMLERVNHSGSGNDPMPCISTRADEDGTGVPENGFEEMVTTLPGSNGPTVLSLQ